MAVAVAAEPYRGKTPGVAYVESTRQLSALGCTMRLSKVFRRRHVLLKSQKDFFSGLLFIVVGGSFAYGASTYQVGTGARMGPGYFPLLLGIILAVMGVVVAVRALMTGTPDGDRIGAIAWRPLFLVLSANVTFGALMIGVPAIGIPQFGLVIAIFALVTIASFAAEKFIVKEVLVLSVILSVGSYAAFVKLLGLQFPVWPSFIAG